MILDLDDTPAKMVLRAIKTVAASGSAGLTPIDHENLKAAGQIALGLNQVDVDDLEDCSPADLASALASGHDSTVAVRLLAVGLIVGGILEPQTIERLRAFARAVKVEEEYLEILEEAAAGRVGSATDRLTESNAESFLKVEGEEAGDEPGADVMPFTDGNDDRQLEREFKELGDLPEGTFGRALFEHFVSNDLDFPGNENGQIEGFVLTHDTCHLLSGYIIDEPGEVRTAAFIAGMHDHKPMEAQILPALFSWHLGIRMNWLVGRHRGAFEPWGFWDAWDRGAKTSGDVFKPGWDFWSAVDMDLEDLRREFGVPEPRHSLPA